MAAEPAWSYRRLVTSAERNKPAVGQYRDMGFTETSDGVWELGRSAQVAAIPD